MFLLFNGEILGKYRLVKPVKCSDISEVWIAVDGGGKFAVLKALHGGAHESERMVALARVLKQADCPGIVGRRVRVGNCVCRASLHGGGEFGWIPFKKRQAFTWADGLHALERIERASRYTRA